MQLAPVSTMAVLRAKRYNQHFRVGCTEHGLKARACVRRRALEKLSPCMATINRSTDIDHPVVYNVTHSNYKQNKTLVAEQHCLVSMSSLKYGTIQLNLRQAFREICGLAAVTIP